MRSSAILATSCVRVARLAKEMYSPRSGPLLPCVSLWSVHVAVGQVTSGRMHLARDYIHPYRSAGGRPSRCRVRIYLPEDARDAPVVICSELPNNSGGSVTNSAEVIAAGVIRSHGLPTPLVWIEHWPEESTDGGGDSFELVVFSSYEATERAPYLGEGRAWLGNATWKRLDRATVEALVGGKV